jgi:type II secretory pathway pseudopilin PulG
MTREGHTLVECITVVLILAALAFIAVPRLNLGAVWGAQTEAGVRQLATDRRRTRMYAIVPAADNPTGYALVMNGASPYREYQIVDLHDSTVVASDNMPANVRCTGRQSFEFGPLGNLTDGSDTRVRIHSQSRAYTLEIVPATGMVKWQREK